VSMSHGMTFLISVIDLIQTFILIPNILPQE